MTGQHSNQLAGLGALEEALLLKSTVEVFICFRKGGFRFHNFHLFLKYGIIRTHGLGKGPGNGQANDLGLSRLNSTLWTPSVHWRL